MDLVGAQGGFLTVVRLACGAVFIRVGALEKLGFFSILGNDHFGFRSGSEVVKAQVGVSRAGPLSPPPAQGAAESTVLPWSSYS